MTLAVRACVVGMVVLSPAMAATQVSLNRTPSPVPMVVAVFADPDGPATGSLPGRMVVTFAIDRDAGEPIEEVRVEMDVLDRSGRSKVVPTVTQAITIRRTGGPGSRVDVLMSCAIRSGRYVVRIRANVGRDWTGGAEADVVVPNFATAELSASDVILAYGADREVGNRAAIADLLPLAPTTERSFATTDSVAVLLRLYAGRDEPTRPVTLTTTVVNAAGKRVFRETMPATPARGNPLRTADYRLGLPLSQLTPGEYVLTLRAESATRASVTKSVRFSVR